MKQQRVFGNTISLAPGMRCWWADAASHGPSCTSGLRVAEPGLAQVIREVMPSSRTAMRLNLDATHVGNAAHFINHRSAGCTLHQLLHVLPAAARWVSGSPQAATTCFACIQSYTVTKPGP